MGPPQYVHLPRTFQTSIGFQRQFGAATAVTADYVYSKGSHEKDVVENINLKFDPATGINLSVHRSSQQPLSRWGVVSMNSHLARSAYHALQTGFTRRFSNRWQAYGTYTLSGLWNADTKPFSGLQQVTFATAPDLGGEWGLSADDQRHRAVFNGIWQVGHGFQLSGLHFFAAGIRQPTNVWRRPSRHRAAGVFTALPGTDGTVVLATISTGAAAEPGLTSGYNSGFPPAASRSTRSPKCSTYSTAQLGIGTQKENQHPIPCRTSGQIRSAQFGFRLTF